MKAKRIYWLIEARHMNEQHEAKIKLLKNNHIVPIILHDFDSLFEQYNHRRTSVVIIGDEFNDNDLYSGFQHILDQPELAGTRFIVSLSRSDNDLVHKAVQLGFRDILPLDLQDKAWLQRFDFASSGTGATFAQPVPQMTLRNICAVNIPARMVWIGADHIRLETRMKIDPGSKFKLMGGLAEYLGTKWLTLTVVEHQRTNLRYRFSDAYICHWSLPEALKTKRKDLLEGLFYQKTKVPHKAYVAISTYDIRNQLISRLKSPQIDINVALHKNSMAEEPRFLNPDIVFIEEKLTKGANKELFNTMMKHIRDDAPIYIVGRNIDQTYYSYWEEQRQQEFIYMTRFTQNFSAIVHRKLEKLNHDSETATTFYIRKDHALSFAEINLSARLVKIHPESVELAVPYEISNYGILGIESPLLRKVLSRAIYAKVTAAFHHDDPDIRNFPYRVHGYLSDLLNQDRVALAEHVVRLFGEHMKRQVENLKVAPLKFEEQRTPAPQAEDSDIIISPPTDVPEEVSLKEDDVPILYRPKPKDTRSGYQKFVDGFKKYGRDLRVLAIAILILLAFYAFVFYARPPVTEQGRVYSEQLLKFQQRFQQDR
ncbi:hypothetical protein [Pseudobacteriovorax antillogorgiicola]|uniref:Uncharacterized protein n=1 Tax=Pseudobacteriovorax antillogorgiicola TaxID=1513793 RepID=A0A1Y6C1V9_9BACT|nr:hypothetical protein [Pseudobacteriovorax antillogorgiicola]TCS50199.1 hypothetical protein EDD56_11317 [Pseudobacteriovorax antillogorgiicola]SMF32247.1 hypothetical protein SAMN06296036_11016 [Pseudobacteriovorax antillogorgiicola]